MSTATPPKPETAVRNDAVTRWYRVPFVWFAILLMLATLVAGIHLIVVSVGVDDESVLETGHERVFKVPAVSHPQDRDGKSHEAERTEPEP